MFGLLTILAAVQLHGAGISLRLPEGWQGDVALERGQATLEATRQDMSLRLDEVGNRPGTSGFWPTRLLALRPQDFRGTQLAIRRVAVRGRSFVVTANVRDPGGLARVNTVLARIVIFSPPGLSPAGRARLERPLELPRLGAGRRCPESRASRAAPNVSTTLGPGPAYPVLAGVLSEDVVVEGAYAEKTLWAVRPTYRGALLIRGRRLDGDGILRFWPGRQRRLWWRGLWPEERPAWRYGATTTLVPRRGCYAFQVDGAGFSRRIVFAAG